MRRSYRLKRLILGFCYPERCPLCEKVIGAGEYFCEGCRDRLSDYGEGFDVNVGATLATAACIYDETAKQLIMAGKYSANGCALSAAAYKIHQRLSGTDVYDKADFICAAPMTAREKRRRGYNQSEIIGRELSELSGIPFQRGILKKTRETAEQKGLKYAERLRNLAGAFEVGKTEAVRGKRIVLIDDVSTTGATLSACVRELKGAGAREVYAAVFAKTLLKRDKI